MTATEMVLRGRLTSEGLPDWVCHRARLLNLVGWVSPRDAQTVSIVVSGPEALVDAMEMACSLGPMDVMVEEIERHPRTLAVLPNDFQRR